MAPGDRAGPLRSRDDSARETQRPFLANMNASDQFAVSEFPEPRLRFGIVVDSNGMPAYAKRILEEVQRTNFVDVVAIIACSRLPHEIQGRSRPDLGIRIYDFITSRRQMIEWDPLRVIGYDEILGKNAPELLRVLPEDLQANIATRLSNVAQEMALDVLFDVTSQGAPRQAVPYLGIGLWRYHFGDSRRYPAGSSFWREIVDTAALSGIELQSIGSTSEDDRILARALFSTSPFQSRRANRQAPLWGSTHFVVQALWEAQRSIALAVPNRSRSAGPGLVLSSTEASTELLRTPRWLAREAYRRSVRRLRSSTVGNQWRIAIRRSSIPLPLDTSFLSLSKFRWLDCPLDRYWADPCLFETPGSVWVFFEDHSQAEGRGAIACGLLTDSGELQGVRTILRRSYHLSYPQIFSSDGEIFMIPESAQAGEVQLYRARAFPHDWVQEAVLLRLSCVDPTVFWRAGRWWMMASPVVFPGHAPITWLFSAPHIVGPWKLDPSGPVAMDASYARGAGRVFHHAGRDIRPSQDCSVTYGRAVIFNEIIELGQNTYTEKPVARVEGGWMPGLLGVHSYSRASDWEAIDGLFDLPPRSAPKLTTPP